MSNNQYLAEEATIKEEQHTHHWVKYIFAVWDNTFLGLQCRDCEKFIPDDSVASYVNELEKKIKGKEV